MVDLDKNDYGSVNSEDTIEITLEDLENEPEPQRVYGTVQSEDTLEITWDDLNAPDPTPTTFGSVPNYTGATGKQSYGAVPNYANVAGYEKKGKKIEAQGVVYPLLVGLVGGFLAFLINEPFTNDAGHTGNGIAEMGLFLGIIGALVSGALSCVDDIKSFVFEKAFKHFLSGALAGFVTGFIGGIIAQIIFGLMLLNSENLLVLLIARTLGWAIAGTFVGLSQSLVDFKFNQKRLKNGLIGGVIGGAIGGILFDPISAILGSLGSGGSHGGWLSRCVAISVMGGAIGCFIGFISESLKEAWLYIVDGPLKGKQFVLYEALTSVGSSPKCNITVVKDNAIAPNHFAIENHQTYYTLIAQAPTLINGGQVNNKNLRDGDIITCGQTSFRYEENDLENKVK